MSIRQGGAATLRHPHGGEDGRRCWFPCQWPGSEDHMCSVPVRPKGEAHPGGAHWEYEGPLDAPTLTPSVNCRADTCWHGWINNGRLVP